jgi:hypothetical protein
MIFRGNRTGDDFEHDCLLENTASGFHGGPFPLQCTYFKEEAILLLLVYIYISLNRISIEQMANIYSSTTLR